MERKKIRAIKAKMVIIQYGVTFFFLFSSELVNAIFNNKLDGESFGTVQRIIFAFKPTVLGIWIVFAFFLSLIVLRYLHPLFAFLRDGLEYDKARTATQKIPWMILIFQIVAWTVGTTAYYIMKGWNADSGIPYGIGLAIKLAGGIIGAVYASVFINVVLMRVKKELNITQIRAEENDLFARKKDLIATAAIVIYLCVNFLYIGYYFTLNRLPSAAGFYLRTVGVAAFFGIVSFLLILLSKREYNFQIDSLKKELRNLASGYSDVSDEIYLINFDELGEMAVYVNQVMQRFRDLLKRIENVTKMLAESANGLSASAQETSVTSNQQAASVAEVVSTMEDSDRLSKDVNNRIADVANRTMKVKENVQEGFSIIRDNMQKMEEVKEANSETIQGIKNLGEEIDGIGEIVKIINSIAGQIKIIAFNAELEASSAGEAGKNFEIVASEIRRLADSTVDSTAKIREKIGDIQHASDTLIDESLLRTNTIQEGWEMSQKIEDVFESILESSEDSAESSYKITSTVGQQVTAFEQILLTLKQISEGVQDFSISSNSTAQTARTLQKSVDTLNELVRGGETASEERIPAEKEEFSLVPIEDDGESEEAGE